MGPKVNCWEFKKCERQAGERLAGELGICPASTYRSLSGIHGGTNAGRACWVVAGTFCGAPLQGSFAQENRNCWECNFFQAVKKEETASPDGFSISELEMIKILETR